MNKILLTRDLEKVDNIKLEEIKNLVKSFKVIEESFSKDEYNINLKIFYSDLKVKKFLAKKIFLIHNQIISQQYFILCFL